MLSENVILYANYKTPPFNKIEKENSCIKLYLNEYGEIVEKVQILSKFQPLEKEGIHLSSIS